MRRIFLFLFLTSAVILSAQTKINPINSINWPLITGSGSPTSQNLACNSTNYGQPYLDISVTPNISYKCGSNSWQPDSSTGISQATSTSVTAMNSLFTSIGATGSVIVPVTIPQPTAAPVYNNPSTVTTTGGQLGPGTYSYLLCSVSAAGVEQRCSSSVLGSSSSNHSSITITTGTTNVINFAFGAVSGISHYNLYGRVAGSWGFIKTLIVGGSGLTDDGSITPGAAPQQNFSNTNAVGVDDLRYGVIQHYATGVPIREFGCAEDGITDDTFCVQSAVNYAIASGIGTVDFTPGKTYKISAISGYVPLAGDDGTCPTSATVNGAACTAIAAQYTMQAYSVSLPGNIKLRLNGAKLIGGYSGANEIASTSSPAMFTCGGTTGCDQLVIDGEANGTNGSNGSISQVFIGLLTQGFFLSSIHDINFSTCGFPLLAQIWDSSEAHNFTVTCEAGFTIGGWYYSRANNGSPGLNPELGGYADGYQIQNARYNGSGTFLANHANTDNYFYTYIYQGQNQGNGRMVDIPGTSSPNGSGSWNSQIPYYGVFGQANILYGRYGRQDNGPYINNFQTKNMTRSAVVASAELSNGTFLTIGAEFSALCDNTAYFVGDPVNCPDPYTTGINAGFIHALVVHGLNNAIANPAGYQATFSSAIQSTYLNSGSTPTQATTIPPNQVFLYGTSSGSASQSSVSSVINFTDNISSTPGNPSTNTADAWVQRVVQNVGNGAAGAGSYFDLEHVGGTATSSNNFFRAPYLMLANGTQGLCDGPTTLYTGHEGILAYTYGATNVADRLAVCTKDATNTFSYRNLFPTIGRATLTAGTVTVSNINASTTSNYQLTNCGVAGTQGMLSVGTVTAGTSFVINSSSATDTSTVCWSIN